MKVLISAAEASSDQHASLLLKALRKKNPDIEAFGVGGQKLQSEGLKVIVPSRSLLAMGFFEIIPRLPRIIRSFFQVLDSVKKEKPDFAILVDYPDFHFRLAKRLKKMGIPVFYFIPPKVWVWRKSRIHSLRRNFDFLYCIFPFEQGFYQIYGLDSKYVGNPTVELLSQQQKENSFIRSSWKTGDELQLALMPGSRPSELKYHLEIFLDGAFDFFKKNSLTRLNVRIPIASTISGDVVSKLVAQWREDRNLSNSNFKVSVEKNSSFKVLSECHLGLIKSGTSTLEAAVSGLPHVVGFRTNRLTHWIYDHLVRYRGPIALSNLLSKKQENDERAFTELLGDQLTVDRISSELSSLLPHSNSTQLKQNFEAIDCVQRNLSQEKSFSDVMVEDLEQKISSLRKGSASESDSFSNQVASIVWSFINQLKRIFSQLGLVKSNRIQPKVVSVGNLQAGGAGKTPIVIKIAKEAIEKGLTTAVLLRGYRSEAEKNGIVMEPFSDSIRTEKVGDEAALIHESVPSAWVGVGRNRYRQFLEIQKRSSKPIDLVVLDDGFQNTQLKKDIEVLAMTNLDFKDIAYRDRYSQAKYADLLVWTKGKNPEFNLSHPNQVQVSFDLNVTSSDRANINFLVTGIGMGERVYSELISKNISIEHHFKFEDHHWYTASEIQMILRRVEKSSGRLFLTQKDWVKWKDILGIKEPLSYMIVLEPNLRFLNEDQHKEIWNKVLWEKFSSTQSLNS